MTSLARFSLGALMVSVMAACSRTVEWQEEVPLNTGDTIWVTRTVEYAVQGAGGNPFDLRYRPLKDEAISFQWAGKRYKYHGDADLILLAISPQSRPVLVAPAADKDWDWNHDYLCTRPHYVQLVPDDSGMKWRWPSQIERWLFGLSANLMTKRRPPAEMKGTYSARDRADEDATALMQYPPARKIDPTYETRNCKHGD